MEIQTRIENLKKTLKANILKKDKVIKSLGTLSGLELNKLDLATRNKLEQNLVAVNKVLRQYPIATFDDYSLISDKHLDKMLTLMMKNYKCLRKFMSEPSPN